jgi:hypothetical protein
MASSGNTIHLFNLFMIFSGRLNADNASDHSFAIIDHF